MIVSSAKLTEKYQITIPAEVRRQLGLNAGDEVQLVIEDGKVILRAAKGSWVDRYWGLGADLWREAGGGRAVIERERKSWDEE
jgi:AbrB family looped-hinge helix DNA binding protein